MKTRYLLPNSYKKIGFVLFFIAFFIWFLQIAILHNKLEIHSYVISLFSSDYNSFEFIKIHYEEITGTLVLILAIIGALCAVLAKEQNEDEYISKIRLESLLWATIVNNAILIICSLTMWDMVFLNVMIYNLITTLILFIIKFHYSLYKMRRGLASEK